MNINDNNFVQYLVNEIDDAISKIKLQQESEAIIKLETIANLLDVSNGRNPYEK